MKIIIWKILIHWIVNLFEVTSDFSIVSSYDVSINEVFEAKIVIGCIEVFVCERKLTNYVQIF